MLIGELSERTGASRRSLRYYEEQGLLAARRQSNGYRAYPDDAPSVVRRIRELIGIGLPTDAIRDLLPCESGEKEPTACARLRERLDGLRAAFTRQALEATRNSAAIDGYLSRNF